MSAKKIGAIICILLASMLAVLAAGCGKEEPLPAMGKVETNPNQEISGGSAARYSKFPVIPVAASEPDGDNVTLLGVGFSGDNAYIMVAYTGNKDLISRWVQDDVYIVDEATMGVYKDIPVMPIKGPLIGRPAHDGQPGYCMLMNYYNGIKSGSVVTVVLGNYKREHYVIP
ncbi:MAG: hypothetical protein PHU08_05450 [Dehalococcoidales bacterium]|nr:hypothetical protein [Dehalococcoidales bacterium]